MTIRSTPYARDIIDRFPVGMIVRMTTGYRIRRYGRVLGHTDVHGDGTYILVQVQFGAFGPGSKCDPDTLKAAPNHLAWQCILMRKSRDGHLIQHENPFTVIATNLSDALHGALDAPTHDRDGGTPVACNVEDIMLAHDGSLLMIMSENEVLRVEGGPARRVTGMYTARPGQGVQPV